MINKKGNSLKTIRAINYEEKATIRSQIHLIKGDYNFSSRHFNLVHGSLLFTGKPNEMPTLTVQAKMNQRGIDILANIQGPLDNPKLVFRSSPPLPASSIMSLLIFGKELSEISEAQTQSLRITKRS